MVVKAYFVALACVFGIMWLILHLKRRTAYARSKQREGARGV